MRHTLRPEDEERLDLLSREFRAELQRRLPNVAVHEEFTDRLIVTIPARHPDTGPIRVRLDRDEITVGVGEYFHCHFETFLDSDAAIPEDQRARVAAERAVDFISEFLADAIVLRVNKRAGFASAIWLFRPGAQSSIITTSNADSAREDETEYLWSGPRTQR